MGLLEENELKRQNQRTVHAWHLDDLKKEVLNTTSVGGVILIIIAAIFVIIALVDTSAVRTVAYAGIATCLLICAVICFMKAYAMALVKCLFYIIEKISDK